MKTQSLALMALTATFFLISCKKEHSQAQLSFTNNTAEGIANARGDYTLTGHISSAVRLDRVTLAKEWSTKPFLVDDATAKNKNDYDFSYLVTGITSNTCVTIDVYDQAGGEITRRFMIKTP